MSLRVQVQFVHNPYKHSKGIAFTIRSVFIIDPAWKKIHLIVVSVGLLATTDYLMTLYID
ncbi:hypothetical protein N7445_007162 [Penicillium cf. griseofulvum]|nr:hypothetical protein N7445_007162 [Penicillium cf. griseofulvum]